MIEVLLGATDAFVSRGDWLIRRASASKPVPIWAPKIYVCVTARHYWSTVARLLTDERLRCFTIKCFAGQSGYVRPDKIVVYCNTSSDLKRGVRVVRELIRDASFHGLRHAAATIACGLERGRVRGLYVGADPTFLNMSWRLYRVVCLAWLQRNVRYVRLQYGIVRWKHLMNLSTVHAGPLSLRPNASSVARISALWPSIIPSLSPDVETR